MYIHMTIVKIICLQIANDYHLTKIKKCLTEHQINCCCYMLE